MFNPWPNKSPEPTGSGALSQSVTRLTANAIWFVDFTF